MIRTIKITVNVKRENAELVERDLGILFLNIAILSLLLPVFLEVLSLDVKKSKNYRSIDSIPSRVVQGASYDNFRRGITFVPSPRDSMGR